MRIYAYVTNQTCDRRLALLPNDIYQERRVSRHGDLIPWRYGKRTTLAILNRDGADQAWMRETARQVAKLLQWVPVTA